MSGEMDLPHMRQREVREVVDRGEAVVCRRDEDIIDVKQQAASGALRDRPDEIRFADGRVPEDKIGRRILEQDRSADRLLHFVDVRAYSPKGRCVVGKGQEIVETDRFVRRPSEMFRDKRRLIAFNKPTKSLEMSFTQGVRTADRHADAVQRYRIFAANDLERAMRRSARAHVVLCMDLKEAATLAVGEDGREMLGFEACARKPRHPKRRKTESRRFQLDVRGRVMSHRWSAAFRPSRVAFVTLIRLCRRQRAIFAVWQDDGRASAAANELPRIPLEIDGRGALTGRARTGGAIILAFQGDTETLLFMGGRSGLLFLLGERTCVRQARQGARQRAGEDEGADNSLCRHWLSPDFANGACEGASRHSIIRAERDARRLRSNERGPIKRTDGFEGEMPVRNRFDSRRL